MLGDIAVKTKYWVILFAVLVLACAGLSLWRFAGGESADRIQIYSWGELVYTLPLDEDCTVVIRGKNGSNTVSVKDGAVAVVHADCPDQYCVLRGFCRGGAQIVCLPHQLVIKFLSDQTLDGVVG